MKKSKKNINKEPSNFIANLRQMLQNEQNKSTIAWSQNGNQFTIKNVSDFVENLLPLHYKHKNFSSFIRQLNMYNFSKVKIEDGKQNTYQNQYFKRDQPQLMKRIKRHKQTKKQDNMYSICSKSTEKNIKNIKERQDQLQQMCNNLHEQNTKLMKDNQQFIKIITNKDRLKQQNAKRFWEFLVSKRYESQFKNFIESKNYQSEKNQKTQNTQQSNANTKTKKQKFLPNNEKNISIQSKDHVAFGDLSDLDLEVQIQGFID